ncbi:MAG TPA: hypothetical protein VGI60_01605 [Chthoniobacterales bacterium]|jgi:hypothetical protein
MKIRLQCNSVRLRLKGSEVEQFARTGRVEEKITFGEAAGNSLFYVLETADVSAPQARLTANGVIVQVPAAAAARWITGTDVGLEGTQVVGEGECLHVLIEKDFACLNGTDEQNIDTFPHPLAGTKC